MAFRDFLEQNTDLGKLGMLPKSKKTKLKEDIAKKTSSLESNLKNIPTYQIPQEAQDYLKMLEQTSTDLGKTAQPYNEAVQIAKNQSKLGEAPGSDLARQDIQQSEAQQIQALKESGGGSADVLGAIAKTGMSEQSALRDLAKSNLQYQAQAKQNLQGALMGQSAFQANLLGEQAQLKGQGLQTMINEKGKVQQSQLDKYLTMTDYELQQLGITQQDLENMKNRRAQLWAAGISGLSQIASSAISSVGSAATAGAGG
jgi:hypothetical protein